VSKGITPPKVLGTPKPESSVMMSSTFGASVGGTTRGGHHGVDWSAPSSILPPKGSGAGGSCAPSSVMVPEGEPTPVCARSGPAAQSAPTIARSVTGFLMETSFICVPPASITRDHSPRAARIDRIPGVLRCVRARCVRITNATEQVAFRGQDSRMTTAPSSTQRASTLAALPRLLEDLGVPLDDVLEGTGLARADLGGDRFIPYDAYLTILRQAVERTRREDFGLLLGARQTLVTVGPLAQAVRSSATLGEALADFTAFQISNSTGAATYLHRQDDWIFWGYGSYNPSPTVSPHAHDMVLAVGAMMLRELTGGGVRAVEYASMRRKPGDPRPWQSLGAKVRFGEAETGLCIAVRDMSFPLPAADRQVRDEALRRLSAVAHQSSWGWTARTRHALRALLLQGRARMPDVALHLGCQPRTLRRALSLEGTTFEAIRDGVRLSMARELLSMSSLRVADLALTLDYATPSAFIHAFQRWTGQSPTAWRKGSRRDT
jgi:AraC-like DNA-binding protein